MLRKFSAALVISSGTFSLPVTPTWLGIQQKNYISVVSLLVKTKFGKRGS